MNHFTSQDITVFIPTMERSTLEYAIRTAEEQTAKPQAVTIIRHQPILEVHRRIRQQCKTHFYIKWDDDFFAHPRALEFMVDVANRTMVVDQDVMFYWQVFDIKSGSIIESIKLYNFHLTARVGFSIDHRGGEDWNFLVQARDKGYRCLSHPDVLAVHATGTLEEQRRYRAQWQSMATNKSDPCFDPARVVACDLPVEEQYHRRLGLLAHANQATAFGQWTTL